MLQPIATGRRQDNPFCIEGPALISFSGGRTSGYMLYHVVQAHGGSLPDHIKVVFANTGKERPETLDFVAECGERWGVEIVWVEYDWDCPHRTRIVSHATASRKGEPFEALIDRKGFLPNPTLRYCTAFLKRDRIESYARHWLGWDAWSSVIGLRHDEPRRVRRMRVCGTPRTGGRPQLPLDDARVTGPDVLAWWRSRNFDLRLGQHEGNCDLCYLKARAKIEAIMAERPEAAGWWIRQEAKPVPAHVENPSESFRYFRIDRDSYASMADQVARQGVLGLGPARREVDWEGECCVCTD